MADAEVVPTAVEPEAPAPERDDPTLKGSVKMLASENNTVYDVPASQQKAYAARGYTRYAGPIIEDNEIDRTIGHWNKSFNDTVGDVGAAATGAINQVPGLDFALDNLAPDSVAKEWADTSETAQKEHPFSYKTGVVGGTAASFLGGGALLKGVLKGTSLAAKAAQLAKASPILASIGEGALSSGALDAVEQADEAALHHAATPEGQEKLAFSYSQLAIDSILGGAIPGAAGGALKAAGAFGRWGEKKGGKILLESIVSPESQENLKKAGKGHIIKDIFEPLAFSGADQDAINKTLADEVHSAGTNIDHALIKSRDHTLTLDEATTMHDRAMRTGSQNLAGLDDMRGLTEAVDAHKAIKKADEVKHLMKQRLKIARKAAFNAPRDADGFRGIVTTIQEHKAAIKNYKTAVDELKALKKAAPDLPMDADLQKAAKDIYGRVNFDAHDKNGLYSQFHATGLAVAEGRHALMARVGKPADQVFFRRNMNKFSDYSAAIEGLTGKNLADVHKKLGKMAQSATVAGAAAGFGLKAGGALGSAGASIAFQATRGLDKRAIAWTLKKVAPTLRKADSKIATAIKVGLYAGGGTHVFMHDMDYQSMAARMLQARSNPVTTASNIHESFGEAGMPDHIRDKVAMRSTGAVQAASQALPKRQGASDVATAVQPDPVAQRGWVSETRSRFDPTHALAYPTKRNMDAAKQHHPEIIARAQESLMQQLAKNPYLPIASKTWASRVLGRPIGGLNSPAFAQGLAQLRAKDSQDKAGAGEQMNKGQRGNGAGHVAQSEQTRMGELQRGAP